MQADGGIEGRISDREIVVLPALERVDQIERACQCPIRIALRRPRLPEKCHDSVANELVDCSAMVEDRLRNELTVSNARELAQIGEHDRRVATLQAKSFAQFLQFRDDQRREEPREIVQSSFPLRVRWR